MNIFASKCIFFTSFGSNKLHHNRLIQCGLTKYIFEQTQSTVTHLFTFDFKLTFS